MSSISRPLILLVLATGLWCADPAAARPAAKKPLTFAELMKFRTLEGPVLADEGGWLAYEQLPDRGDGEVVVIRADGRRSHRIPRGSAPALSPDGRWLMAVLKPTLEATETAEDDKPKPGLAVLDTSGGELITWQEIEQAALSKDGRWLARLESKKVDENEGENAGEAGEQSGPTPEAGQESPENAPAGEESPRQESEPAGEVGEPAGEDEGDEKEEEKEERLGTTLRLRRLADGRELELGHVTAFAFDDTSAYLAYAVAAPGGACGLWLLDLDAGPDSEPRSITAAERAHYSALTWARDQPRLAFVAAIDDEEGEPGEGTVWVWHEQGGEGRAVATAEAAPEGWFIPSANELQWSRDGLRLFFGTRPRPRPQAPEDEDKAFDPYDLDALVADAGLDVWHVDDPLIKPNERAQWAETEKERTYRAVRHFGAAGEVSVQLADLVVREIDVADNPRAVLGRADVPHLRRRTFDGFFADLYWISLTDGSRQLVAESLESFPPTSRLSPDGRYVLWYRDLDWHLFDADSGTSRNLTAGLGVSFADEDHDYPRPADSHGAGGWLSDSSAVLVYDRHDIWALPVAADQAPRNLTAGRGRAEGLQLRLLDEDPDEPFLDAAGRLLVEGYREATKARGFWQLELGEPAAGSPEAATLRPLLEDEKTFTFIARAKEADRVLFSRESYREFPDLWISGVDFKNAEKLSDANPQIADYAWGHAELVHFNDADGRRSDAVLIRPENLEEGERCPVLVYYYRFFSQRLHRFNEPKVNHRPSFPVYASHGYCVFLPDVRFEIGRPGLSATKALVPAVQRLVELGIADPDGLGLHGHSWSGYQTAHVITQTHLFAAAVAGAPVSNMTSAYGGIRYGTGLARQFQYESGQSRLGTSLWQARDRYIENSPLFFADRIETPLLIQFGDQDEAVPWTQGIELYLALRRLGKEAVFLQYHGEPHHLKKYPNKLDYSIKMKEFFDHHLKGAPAPVWMTEGVPYRGDDEESE